MISDDVKSAILQWLRFERQYAYIATEVGSYSSDILAANNEHAIEVEVKVDFYDLKKDFQKTKHGEYERSERVGSPGEWWTVPNRFYFAVPKALEERAKKYLEDNGNKKYGLLVVSTSSNFYPPIPKLSVHCARPARLLHKSPPSKHALELIAKRMSSELCGFYAGDFHLRQMSKVFREAGRAWCDPETFKEDQMQSLVEVENGEGREKENHR